MGHTYYRVSLLIPPDNLLSFDEIVHKLETHLRSRSPKPLQVVVEGQNLILRRDHWSLKVYWEVNERIKDESEDIAEKFASERPDKHVIAACNRRITTAGDPDPNMDYFNEFVYVLEVFEQLANVYMFDPDNGKLRKTDEPDNEHIH